MVALERGGVSYERGTPVGTTWGQGLPRNDAVVRLAGSVWLYLRHMCVGVYEREIERERGEEAPGGCVARASLVTCCLSLPLSLPRCVRPGPRSPCAAVGRAFRDIPRPPLPLAERESLGGSVWLCLSLRFKG